MSVRAKFTCVAVKTADEPAGGYTDNSPKLSTISLSAVADGSEENKQFFRWTPSGQISLSTVNPAAAEQFKQGKSYYVDFTEAS